MQDFLGATIAAFGKCHKSIGRVKDGLRSADCQLAEGLKRINWKAFGLRMREILDGGAKDRPWRVECWGFRLGS